MKKITLLAAFFFVLNVALVSAQRIPQTNNVRIVEDTIWVFVFIIVFMTSLAMMKLTKGGALGLHSGYTLLLLSSISGVLWKGIGLVKRVAIASNPDWFFNIARETFEGLTGLIFGIAFVVLFIAVKKK